MRNIGVETIQGDGWWEIQINDGKGRPLMRLSPGEATRLAGRLSDQGHHDLAGKLHRCCENASWLNAQLKKTGPDAGTALVTGPAQGPGDPVDGDCPPG